MAVASAGDLTPPALLLLLADGRLHSGEELAQSLGMSRAGVWKGIGRLRGMGIEIEAVARRGYRLPRSVELLDEGRLRAALRPQAALRLRDLQLPFEVDSTNYRMLARDAPPAGQADVMVSELQTGGRGRRGRTWFAPFGTGLTLSVAWSFIDAARASPSLSLSVGVAVARALAGAGADGILLKWPNDIWFQDRKLGGVLLELRAEASGPAHVVIGIGLNVDLSVAARRQIESSGVEVAAVADACRAVPSRNSLAGAIIDQLLSMLADFETRGFAPYRAPWLALDALAGRRARVITGSGTIDGVARGVDLQGALILERDGKMQKFVSGEVSLRVAEGGTWSP